MGEETVTAGGTNTGEGVQTNAGGNLQGQNTVAEPSSNAPNNQNTEQNGSQTERTYTAKELQSETDRRVAEALKTAQAKWTKDYEMKLETEKAEAARLAKLSAEERAKEEFKNEVKQFNADREKYNAERLTFECTRKLAAENLPVEFADMLTGADSESTEKNIEAFKEAFSNAIEAAVTERLKGTPPKTGKQENGNDPDDAFLAGFGI